MSPPDEKLRFHPNFLLPTDGVTLQATDGLAFRASSDQLSRASPFFRNLFNAQRQRYRHDGRPQKYPVRRLIIPLHGVDSTTLEYGLEALHAHTHDLPPPRPPYLTVEFLDQCLLLSDVYGLPILLVLLKALEYHASQPGAAFALAARVNYPVTAARAARELFSRPHEFDDSWWARTLSTSSPGVLHALIETMHEWSTGYTLLVESVADGANMAFGSKCSAARCPVVRAYGGDFGQFLDEQLPLLWPLVRGGESRMGEDGAVFPWVETRKRMKIECAACRTHLGALLLRAWRLGYYPSNVEFELPLGSRVGESHESAC